MAVLVGLAGDLRQTWPDGRVVASVAVGRANILGAVITVIAIHRGRAVHYATVFDRRKCAFENIAEPLGTGVAIVTILCLLAVLAPR